MKPQGKIIIVLLVVVALAGAIFGVWRLAVPSAERFQSRHERLSDALADEFMHAWEYNDCDEFLDLCEETIDLMESRDAKAYLKQIESKNPLFRVSELAPNMLDSLVFGATSEVLIPCLTQSPGDSRWSRIKYRYEQSDMVRSFKNSGFDAGKEIGDIFDRIKRLMK